MSATRGLTLSDAEVTFLALEMGKPYFPATPPPTLQPDGWKTVIRGLEARGVLRGRFKLSVADDVAEVLEVVLSADCSLWTHLLFAAGEGETSGQVLWLKDDAIVRHTAAANGTMTFVPVDRQAVDDMLEAVLDFPTAAQSQPSPPETMPMMDLDDAVGLSAAEGPDAAAARFPKAARYVNALADARFSPFIEYRSAESETQEREKLTFAESRSDGLWLVHDDRHVEGRLDGVMTRVQRVTPAMAREEANALVYEGG